MWFIDAVKRARARTVNVNEHLACTWLSAFRAEAHCARGLYGSQIILENTTYSLLINTYIKDPGQQGHFFDAIKTVPCPKCKADWTLSWISDKYSCFDIAFAAVEGILFSGSFVTQPVPFEAARMHSEESAV